MGQKHTQVRLVEFKNQYLIWNIFWMRLTAGEKVVKKTLINLKIQQTATIHNEAQRGKKRKKIMFKCSASVLIYWWQQSASVSNIINNIWKVYFTGLLYNRGCWICINKDFIYLREREREREWAQVRREGKGRGRKKVRAE